MNIVASHSNLTHLSDTMVVISYIYRGYVFKMPVYTYDQGDNWWGLGMTLGIFGGANLGAYLSLRHK
jgi:uncharacterized membrane protein YfcA